MGWNEVTFRGPGSSPGPHPVFQDLGEENDFYFVHSFYPQPALESDIQGTCDYGGVRFAAAIARRNLVAVQFHAEKSGRPGLRILENFLHWKP
jgi:glutamine amidotransferase